MSKISTFAYAVSFQAGWFLSTTSGSLASAAYTLVFLVCHFWFIAHNLPVSLLRKEILWVLIISILGLIIEIISFSSGLLYTKTQQSFDHGPLLPPIWLLCIWIMFALALRTCLSFLFNNLIISCLLCVIFVPINYYAGAGLNNEVAIGQPHFFNLGLITFMWILFLWCAIYLKRYFFEDLFNAH